MTHRGILVLAALLLCTALLALAKPQDQGGRPPTGWYNTNSRPRRPPYNQPNTDNEEPDFGTREDYGSRDPGYGRRTRPGTSRRLYTRPFSERQPPSQPDRSRQPVYPGPQPPPDTPRQPVFGGYNPQPPVYNPQPPVYNPQPPVYPPRPPVYDPRPPVYPPRQPLPPPRPYPQPDQPPRPYPQPDQPPRPYPQPDQPPRPYPQPDQPPRPYPQPDQPPRPYPQPVDSIVRRPEDELPPNLGGKYNGPDFIGREEFGVPFVKGPKTDPSYSNNCDLTCRGQCTIRDENCNCVRNMTCYNELKHRLDEPHDDSLDGIGGAIGLIPGCPEDCGECGYPVKWPDNWCLCETDPNCTPGTPTNFYNRGNRKRDVDLQKLIMQRDAHMAELKRASRHSHKTKRDTTSQRFN